MKTLLKIDTSTRAEASYSKALAKEFTTKWQEAHGGHVIERDLAQHLVPHVTQDFITAMYTPKDQRDSRMQELLSLSDIMIEELRCADTVLLSVPMFNFSIPSVLKAYIDAVTRVGETFLMKESGFEGLIKGKRLVIVAAYGADFSSFRQMDFVEPYLKSLFGFLGFEDIHYFALEGTTMLDAPALEEKKRAIMIALEKLV